MIGGGEVYRKVIGTIRVEIAIIVLRCFSQLPADSIAAIMAILRNLNIWTCKIVG